MNAGEACAVAHFGDFVYSVGPVFFRHYCTTLCDSKQFIVMRILINFHILLYLNLKKWQRVQMISVAGPTHEHHWTYSDGMKNIWTFQAHCPLWAELIRHRWILSVLLLRKGTMCLKAPYFFHFITLCPALLICRPSDTNQLYLCHLFSLCAFPDYSTLFKCIKLNSTAVQVKCALAEGPSVRFLECAVRSLYPCITFRST